MSKPSRKAPELRFKGFTDDWEQRKLSDLGKLNRGKSKHRPRNDSKLFGGTYPFIQTGDVSRAGLFLNEYQQTYSEFGIQQSKLWSKGTLLITIAANIAETSILNIEAAFPDSIIGFESEQIDMIFMKNILDNASNTLKRKAETSSQANLNLAKLSELNIKLPSLIEQNKIGGFLKELDDMITLHQRKLDALKRLKEAYLQNMFPKNGESAPKLRFANFEEEWEQRKIENLSRNSFGGGTPKTTIESYWNGEITWIQSSDLLEHQVSKVASKKKITEDGLQNSAAKLIPENSIAIVTRVGVGKIALMDTPYATSQDFISLSDLNVNKWFGIYSLYNHLQKELHKVQGTSIKGITKNDLLIQKMYIPIENDEQVKIGDSFKRIDKMISLQQQRLEQLQKLKKAYLQKMFI